MPLPPPPTKIILDTDIEGYAVEAITMNNDSSGLNGSRDVLSDIIDLKTGHHVGTTLKSGDAVDYAMGDPQKLDTSNGNVLFSGKVNGIEVKDVVLKGITVQEIVALATTIEAHPKVNPDDERSIENLLRRAVNEVAGGRPL